MGKSIPGFILGLIGGIIGVISGLMIFSLRSFALLATLPIGKLFGTAYIALGIWYLVTGALVIWFSTWMKNEEKCKSGGIWTLILSVIGSGGILGLIGGIFGIVQGSK